MKTNAAAINKTIATLEAGRKAGDSWAFEFGALCAHARNLADRLDAFLGLTAKPQEGCDIARLSLGDSEAAVEYEYTAEDPGRLYGPPEDCYPSEPEEINVLAVMVNGTWVDTDVFREEQIERWQQQISQIERDRAEHDADERAMSEPEYL